jgi:hypothetical protein
MRCNRPQSTTARSEASGAGRLSPARVMGFGHRLTARRNSVLPKVGERQDAAFWRFGAQCSCPHGTCKAIREWLCETGLTIAFAPGPAAPQPSYRSSNCSGFVRVDSQNPVVGEQGGVGSARHEPTESGQGKQRVSGQTDVGSALGFLQDPHALAHKLGGELFGRFSLHIDQARAS